MGYSEKGAIRYLDFVCKSDLLKKSTTCQQSVVLSTRVLRSTVFKNYRNKYNVWRNNLA